MVLYEPPFGCTWVLCVSTRADTFSIKGAVFYQQNAVDVGGVNILDSNYHVFLK